MFALLLVIGEVFVYLRSDAFFFYLRISYGLRFFEYVSVFFRTIEATYTSSSIF